MKKIVIFFIVLLLFTGSLAFGNEAIKTFNKVFQTEYINQVSLNEGLTFSEAKKILENELNEIENNDNLKSDLLGELLIGINGISDNKVKNELLKKYNNLLKITDGGTLYIELTALFNEVDSKYKSISTKEENYDFEIQKNEIIGNLESELKYIEAKEVKENIKENIKEKLNSLKSAKNEEVFFNGLDEIDDTYNSYIDGLENKESEEKSKKIILVNLEKEISNIESPQIKEKAKELFKNIEKIETEELFFESIEDAYDTLDIYYETEGIENYDEDFDFENKKQELILEMENEFNQIENEEIKEKLRGKVESKINELKSIDNEEDFFEGVEYIYEEIEEDYIDLNDEFENEEELFEEQKEDNFEIEFYEDEFENEEEINEIEDLSERLNEELEDDIEMELEEFERNGKAEIEFIEEEFEDEEEEFDEEEEDFENEFSELEEDLELDFE